MTTKQNNDARVDYALQTSIAACAARNAATMIEEGQWVEAYIHLHQAAKVCWDRRNDEPQQPNDADQRPAAKTP